jgi:two-component system sensor histidine kinase/response regulator
MTANEERYSILVVDDNNENLRVIGTMLQDAGYQVGFALDGKQALELLRTSGAYDLVLLDVNMPVMNGFDACAMMRGDEALRDIPVIFLTALADVEHVLAGFDAGGQDYVTKPFHSAELLSRVRTHLELKTARDKLKSVNQWLEERVKERTRQLDDANEKLEKSNRELLRLDETKNNFLHLIGHEIRTPLTGVVGLTDILMEELGSTGYAETMKQLSFSVRRLERFALSAVLITDFRENNVLLQTMRQPLGPLVSSSVSHLSGIAGARRVTFNIEDVAGEAYVMCDARLTGICLDNVFENAVKYSNDGGGVYIGLSRDGGMVHCEVRDEGRGFTQQAMDHLFDLFELGEKHSDQHRGLGLALAKRIIDEQGGSLEAGNNPDRGAFVRMTFRCE